MRGNLEEVVGAAGRVKAIVDEIAVANQEQARAVAQLNAAVSQINQVTQQNAASAEESASAAEELTGQAQLVLASVGRFRLGGEQVRRVTRPSGRGPSIALLPGGAAPRG